MLQYLWFIPLGFVIGACGTLIGAGGGFILVPVLLLLYPNESPELITSISLAVVFFNTLSGSWAYGRMGRIDYKTGLLFASATIPGAIGGALTTAYIPRQVFDIIFGLLLLALSVYLLLRPHSETGSKGRSFRVSLTRTVVETNGTTHTFSYIPLVGVGLSFFVGYISSLLGIGGGIIHVPALVQLLDLPVHIATATSHFILAIMALTGTIVHIVQGVFVRGIWLTLALAIGVLLGAPLGASLSNRVRGDWIIRGLAIGVGLVAIRLLITAL